MTKLWEALDILREGGMAKDMRVGYDGKSHCAIGLLDAAHHHIVTKRVVPLTLSGGTVTWSDCSGTFVGSGTFTISVMGGLCETCAECTSDLAVLDGVIAEQFPERYAELRCRWGTTPSLPISRVVAFNNHEATTQEELELVFHKAAVKTDEVLSEV